MNRCVDAPHLMSQLRTVVAALLLFVATGVPASAAAQSSMRVELPRLDAADYEELLEGNAIRGVSGAEVHRGEVIGMIRAPVDELAAIILDYENLGEWSPAAYDVRIIERTSSSMVVEGKTRLPWPITDRTWHNRATHGAETVGGIECFVNRWQYVPGSGNMDDTYGYWLLFPYHADPTYTVIRYVGYADPGIALPDFVIDWATRRALPDIIANLRERHDALY